MLSWVDFYILIFWFTLSLFLFNNKNNLNMLIYAELSWLILYTLSVVVGAQLDDIIASSLTFFILGFGGLEFVIGLMLVVMLKNNNKFNNNDTKNIKKINTNSNSILKKWHI